MYSKKERKILIEALIIRRNHGEIMNALDFAATTEEVDYISQKTKVTLNTKSTSPSSNSPSE